MSALQAMGSYGNDDNDSGVLSMLYGADRIARILGRRICFQWVPGHVGLAGNEKADALANRGVRKVAATIPVTYSECLVRLKESFKREWEKEWAEGSKGRVVFKHMKKPSRSDPWWNLQRWQQSIITQLRTRHCPSKSYLSGLKITRDDQCRHCGNAVETVEHVIIECPALAQMRQEHIDGIQDVDKYLYRNWGLMKDVCSFVRESGVLSYYRAADHEN
ncbi:uncharacterized protein LOC131958396 [Physella acuta]|uniref:uncharacterized protein LOC131958396 n=1 Tax=Physella acuta TaxID=109671 RepID=UPI0027DCB499|nr:uncharacterized protein LOC131958396 [Physella acuta]